MGPGVQLADQSAPYRGAAVNQLVLAYSCRSLVSLHHMEQEQEQGMRSNHDPGRSTLSPGIEFYRGGFEI